MALVHKALGIDVDAIVALLDHLTGPVASHLEVLVSLPAVLGL